MEHIPSFLIYSLQVVVYLKYTLVFLGAIIEGPILMIASGFLLHQGFFTIVPLFFALVLGDLVGDVVWYYIGYYFSHTFIRKFGKFFSLTEERFEKVKIFFYKHHSKILFFSKFVMGFGLAIYILMVAGATKVNFLKYMILNAIGEFFFVAMLLYIGYSFGGLYHYFSNGFKIGFIVIIFLLLLLIISNVQKYLRDKTLEKL